MSMFMGSFRLSRERGESTAHPGLLSRSLSLSDSHLKITVIQGHLCSEALGQQRDTQDMGEGHDQDSLLPGLNPKLIFSFLDLSFFICEMGKT